MRVDFEDFRRIEILVDQQKNIVIFPISKTDFPIELANGNVQEYGYLAAYYPIELKFPYDAKVLAEKIEYGIEQWDKHPCYQKKLSSRNTFEEKYYGIKGFKNAIKGKRLISLGWDDMHGKYVSLFLPTKRGYAYIGLDDIELTEDADWMDYAKAVIEYIDMDITQLRRFKTYRANLNI